MATATKAPHPETGRGVKKGVGSRRYGMTAGSLCEGKKEISIGFECQAATSWTRGTPIWKRLRQTSVQRRYCAKRLCAAAGSP